ncbi:MAG: leucine-rich repeat protein [Clostridia bacterium]|nr:leucine-rich repeat protein [Clostridia bacterium]
MGSENNQYNIINPDGMLKEKYDEKKHSYANDSAHFVREDSSTGQQETVRAGETADDPRRGAARRNAGRGEANARLSASDQASAGRATPSPSAAYTAAQSATAATSTATSATAAASVTSTASLVTTIGSSIGAIAGTIAVTAVSVVIIVAVFVSSLTINLSLVMADTDSFIFQIQMTGAQEEDFETPIYAILTGEDGMYQEQQLSMDSLFLTFSGLEPDTVYTVFIKNEQQLFVEKTFVTSVDQRENGSIYAFIDDGYVIVKVEGVELKEDEIYTLTVKSGTGDEVFVKDSDEPDAVFSFETPAPGNLFFSLSVGGRVCAVFQIEILDEPDIPEYDMNSGTWSWSDDHTEASISFAEIGGGEPLVVKATVEGETFEPSCEADGYTVYTAIAVYDGISYSDEAISVSEGSATGHSTEGLVQEVPAGCEEDGMAAHYVCSACGSYLDADGHVTTYEALVISALGHDYGELIEAVPAGTDSIGMEAHYVCSVCGKYFDADKQETTEGALVIAATGHVYGELIEAVAATCEEPGMAAHYHCPDCDKYYTEYKIETTEEDLVIPALGHEYGDLVEAVSATCEETGTAAYYVCTVCGKLFDENHEEISEDDLVIPAQGHAYGELVEAVPATCEETGTAAHYVCSVCGKLFDENMREVTEDELIIPLAEHELGELIEGDPASCEESGMEAHYACSVCGKLFDSDMQETTEDDLVIPATGHSYGQLIAATEADCEEDGMSAHYICSVCQQYFDANKNKTSAEALTIEALGHEYGELIEGTPAECEEPGTISYYSCSVCGKLFDENFEEITEDDLEIPALGHAYGNLVEEIPATCEENGTAAHYVCGNCGQFKSVGGGEITEEDLVIEALGHAYGEPVFEWQMSAVAMPTATAVFTCTHDSSHKEYVEAEVTQGNGSFIATAVFQNQEYIDEYIQYLVTFDTDGGTEIEPVYVRSGNYLNVDPPTKEGYVFAGWYRDNDLIDYFGDSPVTEEMALTAAWVYDLDFTAGPTADTLTVTGLGSYDGTEPEIPREFMGKPVVAIGSEAFMGSAITDLYIGGNVTSIGSYAAANCASLTSVSMSYELETIGDYAFSNCTSLVEIWIPGSVTHLGEGVFSGCTSLETVHFEGTEEMWATLVENSTGWDTGVSPNLVINYSN